MIEKPYFPLVRKISAPFTGLLVRTPLSANHTTFLSLIFGITACWFFAQGDMHMETIGALLFCVCYVLDNCDGEVARLKNQASKFGMHFDTFVDWLVHSLFFISLGLGKTNLHGDLFWQWLGIAAAVGGTINYIAGLILNYFDPPSKSDPDDAVAEPVGAVQWFVYIFRELTRADFCFLVLFLTASGGLWMLLPAGAVGAQIYWMLLLTKNARKFGA